MGLPLLSCPGAAPPLRTTPGSQLGVCVHMLGVFVAVLADHCVDDIFFVEGLLTGLSAFTSWHRSATNCGWDIQDRKSPPPCQKLRTLGTQTDMSAFPAGDVLLLPAPDRVRHIFDDLQEIMRSRRPTPAFAGKLFGRMTFASSQYFIMLRVFPDDNTSSDVDGILILRLLAGFGFGIVCLVS